MHKMSLMSLMSILLLSTFILPTSSIAKRESRNYPKNTEAFDIIEKVGGEHRIKDNVKMIDSIKFDTTYYHIFSGYADDGGRIIIFDNHEQYLGYYASHSSGKCSDSPQGFYISPKHREAKSNALIFCPIGPQGPWEKIYDKFGTYMVFNPTPNYSYPEITTEPRKWTSEDLKDVFSAKIAFLNNDHICLQLTETGVIRLISIDRLSREDQKYIKSIKKDL